MIDARPASFFTGKEKAPASQAYGHIPGALNIDSAEFYDPATNRLKPKAELAKIATHVPDGAVVAYCNTGRWAATGGSSCTKYLDAPTGHMRSMVEWTSNVSGRDQHAQNGRSEEEARPRFLIRRSGIPCPRFRGCRRRRRLGIDKLFLGLALATAVLVAGIARRPALSAALILGGFGLSVLKAEFGFTVSWQRFLARGEGLLGDLIVIRSCASRHANRALMKLR